MKDTPRDPSCGGPPAEPGEPVRPARTCGLAVAGLALVGAWAALQVALDQWDVVAAGAAMWAMVLSLSFALPALGASLSVLALLRIQESGGQLGGRSLAVLALALTVLVGAAETVRGRPITMFAFAVAVVVTLIVAVVALIVVVMARGRKQP